MSTKGRKMDSQKKSKIRNKPTPANQHDPATIVVYFLLDTCSPRSYRGYTVNLKRRFAQHCGKLSGGARYTKTFGSPHLLSYVSGFPNKNLALSFEWFTKKSRVRHFNKRKGVVFFAKGARSNQGPFGRSPHPRFAQFLYTLGVSKFEPLLAQLTVHLNLSFFPLPEQRQHLTHILEQQYGVCVSWSDMKDITVTQA